MESARPQPKVAAAGAFGAFAIALVWVAGQAGIDMPAEVGAAFATLAAFAGGWIKR